jgi:Mn-dependent DtxR family transcriptional regulator
MRILLNEYQDLVEANLQKKIQKALGKYQFDLASLSDYIGAKAKDVAKALANMSDEGQVVKVKRTGIWNLEKGK